LTAPVKRSVVVAGHQTSISLEEPFWKVLVTLAKSQEISLNSLITQIDRDRQGNLSSALRIYVLNSLQANQD
jgi:predicted DNA-binding ribbon-helix-helix protein